MFLVLACACQRSATDGTTWNGCAAALSESIYVACIIKHASSWRSVQTSGKQASCCIPATHLTTLFKAPEAMQVLPASGLRGLPACSVSGESPACLGACPYTRMVHCVGRGAVRVQVIAIRCSLQCLQDNQTHLSGQTAVFLLYNSLCGRFPLLHLPAFEWRDIEALLVIVLCTIKDAPIDIVATKLLPALVKVCMLAALSWCRQGTDVDRAFCMHAGCAVSSPVLKTNAISVFPCMKVSCYCCCCCCCSFSDHALVPEVCCQDKA